MADRMIYDCFLFNDELELLQLRLSFLDDIVDRFVIVESTRTLSGKHKPLYFQQNREIFQKYLHKIIHIVAPVNNMQAWEYEFFQRNYIKEGLKNCQPNDLVVISDADEIVNLKEVLAGGYKSPIIAELPVYYYYFNVRTNTSFRVNLVAEWSFIKDKDLGNRNENFPKWAKVISAGDTNTGWHFSYCYGNDVTKYQDKIKAFSHQEYNTEHYLDPDRIKHCVANLSDLFERNSIQLTREDNSIDVLQPYIEKTGFGKLLKNDFTGKFSVIVPNFNHEKFLAERIISILDQEYRDFELIILDDASTDGSREIIEEFHDSRITKKIYNDQNSGSPFKQWAKGVREAKHSYIWIAESDDLAEKTFLSEIAAALKEDPGAGIVYCNSYQKDLRMPHEHISFASIKNGVFETNKWSADYHENGWDELNDGLKYACTINNASAAVVRKDLLLNILDEIEAWKYHGDWFCYIKAAMVSPVHYLASSLNEARTHDMNVISNKKEAESAIEHFRILKLLLESGRITGKKKLIRFFSDQHLGVSFMKQGFRKASGIIASYFALDFPLAVKVVTRIIQHRFSRKEVKPVF